MKIGVVIARFQIDDLHEGHKALLNQVNEENEKLVVLLGCCTPRHTTSNPLDYKTRRLMVHSYYPESDIFPLNDKRLDEVWTKQLDTLLSQLYPTDTVRLYGSRDSFASHYSGKYEVVDVEQAWVSPPATHRREQISSVDPIGSTEFRRGVIYAAYNRYPICWPAVDIAILKGDDELLLVRKPEELKYRFPGGIVDPEDESFEAAAKREVGEETGLETTDYQYIKSKKINDWRYKGVKDDITSVFFKCKYVFGTPIPLDDLKGGDAKWFKISEVEPSTLVTEHVFLFEKLVEGRGEK